MHRQILAIDDRHTRELSIFVRLSKTAGGRYSCSLKCYDPGGGIYTVTFGHVPGSGSPPARMMQSGLLSRPGQTPSRSWRKEPALLVAVAFVTEMENIV